MAVARIPGIKAVIRFKSSDGVTKTEMQTYIIDSQFPDITLTEPTQRPYLDDLNAPTTRDQAKAAGFALAGAGCFLPYQAIQLVLYLPEGSTANVTMGKLTSTVNIPARRLTLDNPSNPFNYNLTLDDFTPEGGWLTGSTFVLIPNRENVLEKQLSPTEAFKLGSGLANSPVNKNNSTCLLVFQTAT